MTTPNKGGRPPHPTPRKQINLRIEEPALKLIEDWDVPLDRNAKINKAIIDHLGGPELEKMDAEDCRPLAAQETEKA